MAGRTSIDELWVLVDSDPRTVLDVVRAERATVTGHADLVRDTELSWIVGLAHRELGELVKARETLQQAYEQAGRLGVPALAARVAISLAFEIGHTGDVAAALALLDVAEADAAGGDQARLANQRGLLFYRVGALEDAITEVGRARVLASATADGRAELTALINLGAFHSQRGDHTAARACLIDAIELAAELGQLVSGALALANLAYVETAEGNLPEALDAYAAAEDGYVLAGTQLDLPRLHADHTLALADANLLEDAEDLIDRAVAISAVSGNDLELAELLLVSAEIDLARGAADEAHVERDPRGRRVRPAGTRQLAARGRAVAAAGRGPAVAEGAGHRRAPRRERPCPVGRRMAIRRAGVDAAGRPVARRVRARRGGPAAAGRGRAGGVARARQRPDPAGARGRDARGPGGSPGGGQAGGHAWPARGRGVTGRPRLARDAVARGAPRRRADRARRPAGHRGPPPA